MATATVEVTNTETQQKTCDKHGHFLSTLVPNAHLLRGKFTNLEHILWTGCPECELEWKAQREREEEERIESERRERLQRAIQAAGIPKRFQDKTLDNYSPATEEQKRALTAALEYV